MDFDFKPFDWLDSLVQAVTTMPELKGISNYVTTATSAVSFLQPDGNAGEDEARKFMDRQKEDSYFDAWTRENRENSPDQAQRSAWSTIEQPKADSNVIDRLIAGAGKAWEKDPLEVLKFGSGMVGGYFKADRENKLAQAQIDAYNKRIAQEDEERAAQSAGIANYKRPSNAYKGPLLRRDGSRVFNPNGTVA